MFKVPLLWYDDIDEVDGSYSDEDDVADDDADDVGSGNDDGNTDDKNKCSLMIKINVHLASSSSLSSSILPL